MSKTRPLQEIGVSIPNNTPHAVSVTLPTWSSVVGYEEGDEAVVQKMKTGYPRFFIHLSIQELAHKVEKKYGREGERSLIFPSYKAGRRCREFLKKHSKNQSQNQSNSESNSDKTNMVIRLLQLSTAAPTTDAETSSIVESNICVVFFPENEFSVAKSYWQHSGEGISSRMAEYCLREIFGPDGNRTTSHIKQDLQAKKIQQSSPSLSRSLKAASFTGNEDVEREFNTFIEQKYGRVLDLRFAQQAKIALRRRICGKVDKSRNQDDEMDKARRGKWLNETDVYLFPSGMASIFHAHQALLEMAAEPKKSVCFGFPYVDTLNILRKFGPGVHFLGFGDDKSLDQLETGLKTGEMDILALFCECPSNPLLKTPNLTRIKKLADTYNFAVVVDETVGNFLNIHVLPYADIVVSSLTKVFSGDSNVMAGSLILNPQSKLYGKLKQYFTDEYEDNFWAEDALYLERNSRDFVNRSHKIDQNTMAIITLLRNSPLVDTIYYPSISESRHHYEDIKTPDGGYGGLLSFLFKDPSHGRAFFDAIEIHKGPSLGTNFTLACPYAVLAHYHELDEVAKWGVNRNLIRISIGLEDEQDLIQTFQKALETAGSQTQ